MNKLEMAHEYVMNYMASPDCKDTTVSNIVSVAWSYADLMQAEADKRTKADNEEKRKAALDLLNDNNTFVEREGQHFDDVATLCKTYSSLECQPDTYPEYEHGRDYPSDAWVTFNGEARLAASIKENSLRKRPQ